MLDKLDEHTGHWYLFVVDLSRQKGYVLDSCKMAGQSGRIGDCKKLVCSILGFIYTYYHDSTTIRLMWIVY